MITDITTPPVPTPQEAATQGEQEYAALVAMLRTLSPHDWSQPTECPGWTVREMVAHVAGAAEEAVRPTVQVRHMTVARTRDRRMPTVDSLNAQQVADRDGRGHDQILAELESLATKAPRRRAKVPGVVRGSRLPSAVGAPEDTDTMAYLLDVIYNRDIWMHRVDIDRATGCGMPPSAAEAPIVQQVVRDLSRTWAGPPFALRLTGRVEGTWDVGDARSGSGAAGGTVVADAVALCRLLSGRSDELRLGHDGSDPELVHRIKAARLLF